MVEENNMGHECAKWSQSIYLDDRSDAFPTEKKLFIWKIIDNVGCPICETVEETNCHTLWSCVPFTKVW